MIFSYMIWLLSAYWFNIYWQVQCKLTYLICFMIFSIFERITMETHASTFLDFLKPKFQQRARFRGYFISYLFWPLPWLWFDLRLLSLLWWLSLRAKHRFHHWRLKHDGSWSIFQRPSDGLRRKEIRGKDIVPICLNFSLQFFDEILLLLCNEDIFNRRLRFFLAIRLLIPRLPAPSLKYQNSSTNLKW